MKMQIQKVKVVLGSLGLQRLELIEKCQVDILGNVSVVRHENRMGFE